jgi:hypothetical protein
MKTKTILDAIERLQQARNALIRGDLSIALQMKLGGECLASAISLRSELERDVPSVLVVAEVAASPDRLYEPSVPSSRTEHSVLRV